MTTVYVGGPMRGHRHFNFPAFDEAARLLRDRGWDVLNPAEHDREGGFDETLNSLDGFDLDAAMAWDLDAIGRSDAVVFLPGWEHSQGCAIEYEHARRLGRTVYAITVDDARPFGYFLDILHIGREAA